MTSESSRTSPTIQENEESDSDKQSGFYSVFGSNCEEISRQNGYADFPFKAQFFVGENDEIKVKDFVSAVTDVLVVYGNFFYTRFLASYKMQFYRF